MSGTRQPRHHVRAKVSRLRAFGAWVVAFTVAGVAAHEHFVYFADDLRSGGVGPTMALVPSGVVPPCDKSGRFSCAPDATEPVAVGSFAMSMREVSVAEFRMFVGRTGYKSLAEEVTEVDGGCFEVDRQGGVGQPRWDLAWNKLPRAHGDDHAVVCMTYKDASAYARWLSEETGRPYRVPTELEWRLALLAGQPKPAITRSELACVFRRLPNYGRRGVLRPVGSCGPNPFGLYEMASGVDEWTECVAIAGGRCRTPSGRAGCLQGFVLEAAGHFESQRQWWTSTPQRADETEPPRRHAGDPPPWARCGSTNMDGFRVALSSSD